MLEMISFILQDSSCRMFNNIRYKGLPVRRKPDFNVEMWSPDHKDDSLLVNFVGPI